jgi:hypothetical protein
MENSHGDKFSRRKFLASGTLFIGGTILNGRFGFANPGIKATDKPALTFQHFPDPLHAFLWRNWNLVPLKRLARVVKASPHELLAMARTMGLTDPVHISADQLRRSYLTIIRSNWHLLPREQLLELLDWSDEKLSFTLQEDDFFYIKLGRLKPICNPILFKKEKTSPNVGSKWIKQVINEEFPDGIPVMQEPLFHFVTELSEPPEKGESPLVSGSSGFSPRFGYSYFALFGDPLLEPEIDPLPDGFLARMVASGMDGTWMHNVLSKITPFPWDLSLSKHWEQRLENLNKLVARAKKQGIGIYLYLNEPRNLPLQFFDKYPELKGATNDNQASLCTSHPEVQRYLIDSLSLITERIPDLAGFFSITASENPTNCWSHGKGAECPRCGVQSPAAVISALNGCFQKGIEQWILKYEQQSGKKIRGNIPRLIVWDWGWKESWVEELIPALPGNVALMSVSEWDLSIERGGIKSEIGEYSISAVGPGPRAQRHWDIARRSGLKTIAKIQAGNTWEISAVPYIPALENVASHASNLREVHVDGLMLGWTLGGYPSPNLEVVAAIGNDKSLTPLQAMGLIAERRFGMAGPAVVKAWRQYSLAFSEFPFGTGLYNAPMQVGPANLLWEKPTNYHATMVGLAYDAVTSWAGNYPVKVFIDQMEKIANGFDHGLQELKQKTGELALPDKYQKALIRECNVAETIAIHCRSVANQAKFITIRDRLASLRGKGASEQEVNGLKAILEQEIILAKSMHFLQCRDSRLGFEASNHYFYTPADLIEKVLNCRDLLDRWLPKPDINQTQTH